MTIIGDAFSLSNPENEEYKMDDRQEIIKTIGGNVVQDYGAVDSGIVLSCDLTFTEKNFSLILDYWKKRTKVNVSYDGKAAFEARIVLKSYAAVEMFPTVKKCRIEFWKI